MTLPVQAAGACHAPIGDGRVVSREEERRVIFASSLGTVFEWYDFYLYAHPGAVLQRPLFFPPASTRRRRCFGLCWPSPPASRSVPFGALLFGSLGDLVGRKYTFLVTMTLFMGTRDLRGRPAADLRVGRLARARAVRRLPPLQGLALGGEYGGAATYVAEHAPRTAAASPRAGSRPRPRSASSCRCSSSCDLPPLDGARAVRRLGLAHPVPAVDHPARCSRSVSGSAQRSRRSSPDEGGG